MREEELEDGGDGVFGFEDDGNPDVPLEDGGDEGGGAGDAIADSL